MALSLMLGEVFVRAFMGDGITLFPRYHAEATYGDFTIRRLRPQTTFWHTSVDGSWRFTVNKAGFRDDRDFSYDKEGEALRIIALGDSHTQGFEVRQDHTYAAVIERYLDSRGLESEVINAGVSGFGTAEEAVFLEYEGFKYDPDVVVLGFYANDFEDNIKSDLLRLKNGELIVNKTIHAPGIGLLKLHNAVGPLRWFSENSYLYSLALNTAWATAKSALLSRKRLELTTEWAVATGEAGAYEKQLTARLIDRMYRLCKDRGIVFIILDIPQAGEPGEFSSSIPDDLLEQLERSSDALIRSEEVLSQFRQLAEFHVPHGQRHISELSHMLLGVEAARVIEHLAASDKVADGRATGSSTQQAAAGGVLDRSRP
jgi:GDSL-like Lipase/Acylhydrolase family